MYGLYKVVHGLPFVYALGSKGLQEDAEWGPFRRGFRPLLWNLPALRVEIYDKSPQVGSVLLHALIPYQGSLAALNAQQIVRAVPPKVYLGRS